MKNFFLIAVIVLTSSSLLSCKSSSKKDMLVGRWQYVDEYELNGLPVANDSLDKDFRQKNSKILLEFTVNDSFRSSNTFSKETLSSGTYRFSDDENFLELNIDNKITQVSIVSLSFDTLKYENLGQVFVTKKID